MNNKKNDKVDFVIPWVDGSDPKWIKEYNMFVSEDKSIDARNFRYRDWDNLQYWFRGVEKFTPWVNKIHFITWGHVPKWLNSNHPKLNIVRHEDYIPNENLPVFSANPIEINLHRIKGLSENFVYFNDDIFILKPTKPSRYFNKGVPCDSAVETILLSTGVAHIKLNNILIINKYFSKRKQFVNNFFKWINIKYGIKNILRNILLLSYEGYSTLLNHHMPVSYKKSTFIEVWNKNNEILSETSGSKFRNISDVNQYLFRYWQLITGNFKPVSMNDCINLSVFNDNESGKDKYYNRTEEVYTIIKEQKYRMMCLNDGYSTDEQFKAAKKRINESFKIILPKKSSFEI